MSNKVPVHITLKVFHNVPYLLSVAGNVHMSGRPPFFWQSADNYARKTTRCLLKSHEGFARSKVSRPIRSSPELHNSYQGTCDITVMKKNLKQFGCRFPLPCRRTRYYFTWNCSTPRIDWAMHLFGSRQTEPSLHASNYQNTSSFCTFQESRLDSVVVTVAALYILVYSPLNQLEQIPGCSLSPYLFPRPVNDQST